MANNAQIKKLLLSAATLLTLSGAAFAADLPSKKSPALAPVAVAQRSHGPVATLVRISAVTSAIRVGISNSRQLRLV